jgi:hypothetical protein
VAVQPDGFSPGGPFESTAIPAAVCRRTAPAADAIRDSRLGQPAYRAKACSGDASRDVGRYGDSVARWRLTVELVTAATIFMAQAPEPV